MLMFLEFLIGIPLLCIACTLVLWLLSEMVCWIELICDFYNRGFFNYYVYTTNKMGGSRLDSDRSIARDGVRDVREFLRYEQKKKDGHYVWAMDTLLRSIAIGMRSGNKASAQAALQMFVDNKAEFFNKTYPNKKERRKLQKAWNQARHYGWMLDEWKKADYIDGLIFGYTNITTTYTIVKRDKACSGGFVIHRHKRFDRQ